MDQPPPVKPPRGVKHVKETVGYSRFSSEISSNMYCILLEWSVDVGYSSPISM